MLAPKFQAVVADGTLNRWSLFRSFDDVASNPPASRAPSDRATPADRPHADAILPPRLGESALQAANLPAGRFVVWIHGSPPFLETGH